MLRVLIYILVALIPISTELSIGTTLSLDFPLEPLLIILSFIALLYLCISPSSFKPVWQSPIILLLALQLAWFAINIVYSVTPLLSLKFFIAKCWYCIPFCLLIPLVIEEKKHWKNLFLVLCMSMFTMICIAIFRHAGYNFSFVGINKSLSPFFRNHVNYSALLVCLIPTGYLFWSATKSTKTLYLIASTLLLISLLALLLSYSRGAWLALPVGIVAYISIKKNLIQLPLTITAVAIIITICFFANNNRFLAFRPNHDQTVFHPQLDAHLQATINLEDVSNGERMYRWIAGANMIAEKPILGFGTNSFYPTYKAYTVAVYKTWVSNNPDHSTVHNYFLLTFIEQGIAGLILLLSILVYAVYYCQYVYTHSTNTFHKQLAIGAGTTLCMVVFLNCFSDLIETDKIGAVYWLIIAVVISLQIQNNKTKKQHFLNK